MQPTLTLLTRPPLQALYLALALFAGVLLLSPPPALDDTLDEITLPDWQDAAPAAPITVPEFDADTPAPTITAAPNSVAIAAPAAEETPPAPVWLEYRVRRGDTMDRVLRAIQADAPMRDHLLRQKMKTYRKLRIGSIVYFQRDDSGQLSNILYKTSPDYYFTAGRDAAGALWAKEEPPATTTARRERGGTIDSTLYEATAAAGMSDIASDKLVQVLETQIDFYRDVRKGDSFRVIYNVTYDEQGDIVDAGDIVAFEYDNRHEARPRRIRGVHYSGDGVSGYYNPKGESLQRAFLPAPLKYRRISSKFTKRRYHPVLKRWRPHRGVDYAARTGTPVHSTADGVVSLVDHQRGYGKVVMIKHFNIYTTVYAHLSRFKKGMRRGRHVKQGDVIGYVGSTGLSTGPHLHYEFRVRGQHKDPLSTTLPKQLPPLTGEALTNFNQHSAPLFNALDAIHPPQQG